MGALKKTRFCVCYISECKISVCLTSQKNSFPLSPQNQDIQDTSSELLILLTNQNRFHFISSPAGQQLHTDSLTPERHLTNTDGTLHSTIGAHTPTTLPGGLLDRKCDFTVYDLLSARTLAPDHTLAFLASLRGVDTQCDINKCHRLTYAEAAVSCTHTTTDRKALLITHPSLNWLTHQLASLAGLFILAPWMTNNVFRFIEFSKLSSS